jgi:hypothetical protein
MATRALQKRKINHWWGVRPIWPILRWWQCKECKQVFRHEWGWTHSKMVAPGADATYALCHTCAPTRDDAIRLFNLSEYESY